MKIAGGHAEWEEFDQLAELAKDMEAPLTLIGDRLREGIGEQFASEGAWGDEPWPELTQDYGRWKHAHAPGLPMLVGLHRTGSRGQHPQSYAPAGRMRVHLLSPAAFRVTSKRMLYAPQDDVAGYHQTGTSKMEARPPVAIPLREISEWQSIFGDWVDSLLERVRL